MKWLVKYVGPNNFSPFFPFFVIRKPGRNLATCPAS